MIRWYAANTMATATQPSRNLFGVSPGEARAPVPRPSTTTGAAGSPTVKGKPEISSRAKGTKTNRYYAKPSSHLRSKLTKGPESGALQSLCSFKSFENRFSNNYRTTKICRPSGKISSELGSSNPRPRNPRHGCGLQARTHGSPRPTQGQSTFSLTGSKKIEAEISELLQKGALTNVTPDSDQFVSNLFLVPKCDGGSRPVINLKDLNEYLQYNHFKMEGIHLLRDLMRPNDWLGKIDLMDAYFVVPIWENHKKYLRFLWKDSLLEFACLPFGLAVAPRVFTKIMKPVVALLRRTGIRLIIYLDDLLFMNSSKVGLQQDMTTAQYLLENLGFVINHEKSCFQPTQQLEFLGFVVNTLDMTLLLPDCKVEAIKSHCSKMLLHHEVSVRELSQLIGKLTASIQAIFPAPLHYRHLQDLKHKALARFGHFDVTTALSTEAKDELQWWLAHLNAWNGRALVRPSPDVIIETDASRTGWGAVCQGETAGGLWSQMEKKLHINCLELLAGSFAVKSFTKDRLCVHVRLRMDNVSAVAYINRLEGTHSLILSNLALAFWEWALKRNIFLSAEHLSGALNVSADWESRHFVDSSDWKLCPAIFRSLMQVRGPCALDLFANRLNAQLTQFYSWRPDPMALATDALLQNWAVGRLYAFPPFCLIMRCLAKLREEGGELILVTPVWLTQAWYPSLLELSVSLPILLPWAPKLLQGPQGQSHPLVMNQTLQLAAWHVCNDLCSQRAFLAALPSSSWQLGGQVQTQFIIPPGKNGIAGVSQGKLIHFPLFGRYNGVLSSLF